MHEAIMPCSLLYFLAVAPVCQVARSPPSSREPSEAPLRFTADAWSGTVSTPASITDAPVLRSLLQMSRRPLPSGWFGAFSEDESTYDVDGSSSSEEDPFWAVKYGRDPSGMSYQDHKPTLESTFFHESRSGGPAGAWQTHYPSAPGSIASNPWRYTPASRVQDHVSRDTGIGTRDLWESRLDDTKSRLNDADWFDNAVNQVDSYGRRKTPSAFSSRQHIADGWLERSVNTTITCKEPGCRARASLQLFDRSTEDGKFCKISIVVHPTDYEDDWSREHIEYWKVNDFIVSSKCNPRARGCNATAEKPLYHCVSDFSVDEIIGGLGNVTLEGKNSQMVDECPHNDNLLSAVAMGTCLVRKKLITTTTTSLYVPMVYSEAVLKCIDPGCLAETTLHFNPGVVLNGGTCVLSMNVTQTDYDDELGVPEELEFISVGNGNITTKPIQPGRNPCTEEYKGKVVSDEDRIFNAVDEFDVTKLVRETYPVGSLRIASKISPQVDECGYEGHLFHANVRLVCTPPATFSAAPPYPLTTLLNNAA